MCGSMVDIQSATAEIRRGRKEERKKKKDRNHSCLFITMGGHNNGTVSTTAGIGQPESNVGCLLCDCSDKRQCNRTLGLLPAPRRLCFRRCLFVNNFAQKDFRTDLHEIFREGCQ